MLVQTRSNSVSYIRGKGDGIIVATYPSSFVNQIFYNGQLNHDGVRKINEGGVSNSTHGRASKLKTFIFHANINLPNIMHDLTS